MYQQKEQMDSARKIFQHSNKLSRPEKAVVLGFIAGSRKNPYPEQGNVVTVSFLLKFSFSNIFLIRLKIFSTEILS